MQAESLADCVSSSHSFHEHNVPEVEPLPLFREAVNVAASNGFALRRILVLGDVVGVALAWTVALFVAGRDPSPFAGRPVALAVAVAVMTVAGLGGIASQRLYLARVCGVRAVELERLGRASVLAGMLAYLIAQVLDLTVTGVRAALGGLLMFVLLAMFRGGYDGWLKSARSKGRFTRPIVIIGGNQEGFELYRLLSTHPELGFRVSGIVGCGDHRRMWATDVPWLGEIADAARVVKATGSNGAVIAASAVSSEQLNALTRQLLANGVHVHLSSGLKGIAQSRLRSLPLAYEPLFYLEPIALTAWQLRAKRAIDIVLGSVALLLAAPVMIVAAIAIKVQDRGPVFFRQERVGKDGRSFMCIKLRTMVPDAEKMLVDITHDNERSGGPLFKLALDPRRTKVGRLLEATSLDELPQLFNVLRGEMSMVGPRPALPSEVAAFDEELHARHTVPPGITGLWQVEARDNPSFLAYRRLDLFYVENWSVSLDLAILLATGKSIALRIVHR